MASLQKILAEKFDTEKLKGNSFFILSPQNSWRQLAYYLSHHPYTVRFIYVLIVVNAASMAFITPLDDPDSTQVQIVDISDRVVLAVFAIEMCVRMCALGVCIGDYTYWKSSGWNRLDCLVVLGSIVGQFAGERGFTAFRAFRAFRIFRAVRYFKSFKDVMSSLKSALSLVADNSAFMGFFFLVFGVLSVDLFQDSLSRWCVSEHAYANGVIEEPVARRACKSPKDLDSDRGIVHGNCPSGFLCMKFSKSAYYHGKANFDDIFHAVIVIWQISTLSNWTEHVYHLQESEGAVLPALYCFVLIFFMNFIVINLFVAVVGEVFGRSRETDVQEHPSIYCLNYDQREVWEETKRRRLTQTIHWGLVRDDVRERTRVWGTGNTDRIDLRREIQTSDWEVLRHKLLPVLHSRAFLLVVVAISMTNVALKAGNSERLSSDDQDAAESFQRSIDLLFTILLAVELSMRYFVTANGSLKRLFSSTWDAYDFGILLASILSMALAGTSLSFFRMRVLQLAFYYKGLQPVAELCDRTVAGIPGAVSIVVFILFSFFVFGVAGVQFFAGEMELEGTGQRMRLHFDHFISSQLLLFHVMSGDAWETYLRTTWHSTGPIGVFFILFFFVYSAWVLLNLFTAVVLETFQLEDDLKMREQMRVMSEKQMHWGSSAGKNTRSSSHFGQTRKQLFSSLYRRFKQFIALPDSQRLQHNAEILEDALALELKQMLEKGTRSNLESLLEEVTMMNIEPPSEIGVQTHDGKASKKQGKIECGLGEVSDLERNLTVELLNGKSAMMELLINNNCAYRVLVSEIDMPTKSVADDGDDDMEHVKLNLPMHSLINEDQLDDTTEWWTTEVEYSMWVFHYQAPLRVFLKSLVNHPYYEYCMTLAILASTVALILEPPSEALWYKQAETEASTLYRALRALDIVWLCVFGQEVFLKALAFGFCATPFSGKEAYINNGWNVLDLFLFVSMCLTTAMPKFKAVQAFRTLRPIRVLRRIESLHVVVSAIWSSLGATVCIVVGFMYWFLLLGTLGISLFAGKLNYCTFPGAVGKVDCVGQYEVNGYLAPRAWLTRRQNFDSIGSAMQTLVEVTSLSAWGDVMFSTMDIRGRGLQPEFMHSPMYSLYFIVTVIICSFYFVNIFVAVILDKIYQQMGISIMTQNQRAWVDFQKTVRLYESQMHGAKPPNQHSSNIRLLLYHVTTHRHFDTFVIIVVVINIGFMASVHAGQSAMWTEFIEFLDYFFLTAYFLEMVAKIIAYGSIQDYAKNRWNLFDAFIVFGSLMGVVLREAGAEGVAAISVVRMLRICRIFRLMSAATGIRYLFKTLLLSLPAILNIALLALILMLIYTVFGKTVFGNVRFGRDLGVNANFRNTWSGLGAVFRVLTLDNWHYLLHDSTTEAPFCTQTGGDEWHNDCGNKVLARIYYMSFYIVGVYVFINLILAVILDNFGHIFSEHSFCLNEGDVTAMDEEWAVFDHQCTGMLPRYKIRQLLERLFRKRQPLGCSVTSSRHVDRQRFAFMMYALQSVSLEMKDGVVRPAPVTADEDLGLIVVEWRDVINIATLTFVRFYYPECLRYSQSLLWQQEKKSIELTLALRKIGALIQSYLIQRSLEVKFGSKAFLLKKIKEFLNWRKECDLAVAKGRKPPPPPTQKYAALRARMLEKAKREEVCRTLQVSLRATHPAVQLAQAKLEGEDAAKREEAKLRKEDDTDVCASALRRGRESILSIPGETRRQSLAGVTLGQARLSATGVAPAIQELEPRLSLSRQSASGASDPLGASGHRGSIFNETKLNPLKPKENHQPDN